MAKAGKRQIAKLTNKQLGNEIARNILTDLSNRANGIRALLKERKGVDMATQQVVTIRCTPDDVRHGWTPDQWNAIEHFLADFCTEPDPPVKK